MKPQACYLVGLLLLAAVLITLTSCSSTSPPPPAVGSATITYTKGEAGAVLLQTLKTTATVTAIDQAKREATLLGSDRKKFTVKVGPAAVNFDQVREGDRVIATVTQKVAVSLNDNNAPAGEVAAGAVALAPNGDQPGGQVAALTQVTAKVIAIDSGKRTATVRFEDGAVETFPVRADMDLSRHQVGERVVFRVTEMIAIWVEKAP